MHKSTLFLVFALLLGPLVVAQAQIQLSKPWLRAVYQRNNSGTAYIPISGICTSEADQLEARLLPISNGQGTATDWATVSKPVGGFFSGELLAQSGWYRLEVRALKNKVILAQTAIPRVGVGEVFWIAGQSNAQGLSQTEPIIGATDDRVNAYNYYVEDTNKVLLNPKADTLTFDQLAAKNRISPRGVNAWCWGQLGDSLAKRLNVPVLFFNAARGGTSVAQWQRSAAYTQTDSVPYAYLRLSLRYWAKALGARAVLWHQGESDGAGQALAIPYQQKLEYVISQSRTDAAMPNLAWVVARVTQHVGQNAVIDSDPDVFAGPNTDAIKGTPYRCGVHFCGVGHTVHAQAWNKALDSTFFAESLPYPAQTDLALANLPTSVPQLTLQPNPVHDVLEINTAGLGKTDVELRIVNLTGQVLLTTTIQPNQAFLLNIRALPSGLYMVCVCSKTGTVRKKLLKL